MARHYVGDDQEVFRAVLTITNQDEGKEPVVRTATYGPYGTAAPAKALITRETRYNITMEESRRRYPHRQGHRSRVVTGKVERASSITWEPVS